jgi:hypothetical protein
VLLPDAGLVPTPMPPIPTPGAASNHHDDHDPDPNRRRPGSPSCEPKVRSFLSRWTTRVHL